MIRLLVAADLSSGVAIALRPEQAHYLVHVMRQGVGAAVRVFNGRDGEWSARIVEAGKLGCFLVPQTRERAQTIGPDLDLIVALVKRGRLETVVEKAAELGARRVRLMTTQRSNVDRANVARLSAIAVEAAEQTGRLDAPEVLAPSPLERILATWDAERRLMFCDEAGDAAPVAQALGLAMGGPWAVLIGPEGGFSAAERAAVRSLPTAVPVSLGPRILRVDTAATAALTLWQSALGDWRGA